MMIISVYVNFFELIASVCARSFDLVTSVFVNSFRLICSDPVHSFELIISYFVNSFELISVSPVPFVGFFLPVPSGLLFPRQILPAPAGQRRFFLTASGQARPGLSSAKRDPTPGAPAYSSAARICGVGLPRRLLSLLNLGGQTHPTQAHPKLPHFVRKSGDPGRDHQICEC